MKYTDDIAAPNPVDVLSLPEYLMIASYARILRYFPIALAC